VENWRWAGVPFYLRTGKHLPRRATEIAIQFNRPPLTLFKESASDPEPNMLAMRIQPDEGILLRFAAKVPELGLDVRSVNMDFTYGSTFLTDAPEAYETLLLDAMLGDASLFTRADEVEAAWGLVTPLNETWAEWGADSGAGRGRPKPARRRGNAAVGQLDGSLQPYEAGSWGPEAADRLLARDGRRWRRL
jgi:glucose-6-phosphate 1-dehydrogenase